MASTGKRFERVERRDLGLAIELEREHFAKQAVVDRLPVRGDRDDQVAAPEDPLLQGLAPVARERGEHLLVIGVHNDDIDGVVSVPAAGQEVVDRLEPRDDHLASPAAGDGGVGLVGIEAGQAGDHVDPRRPAQREDLIILLRERLGRPGGEQVADDHIVGGPSARIAVDEPERGEVGVHRAGPDVAGHPLGLPGADLNRLADRGRRAVLILGDDFEVCR